jgi:hypothetical protein
MVTVEYEHEFDYLYGEDGGAFPRLIFRIHADGRPDPSVDIDTYLDSGAERSLFDGTIARALEIDLFAGERLPFSSTAGPGISAVVHGVRLHHESLGEFELDIAFSTAPIARNLLGRDLFNRVEIGFQERLHRFLIAVAR